MPRHDFQIDALRFFIQFFEDLAPLGPRGAAAALSSLENVEERAHARLLQAIEEGDPFKTRTAREFYLRSSEVLCRLEIAVLTERRHAGEQVPKFLVEQISTQISEWLRAAFQEFLSSESRSLMGIKDHGEFRRTPSRDSAESCIRSLNPASKPLVQFRPGLKPRWSRHGAFIDPPVELWADR
jgi:hypothetical protein